MKMNRTTQGIVLLFGICALSACQTVDRKVVARAIIAVDENNMPEYDDNGKKKVVGRELVDQKCGDPKKTGRSALQNRVYVFEGPNGEKAIYSEEGGLEKGIKLGIAGAHAAADLMSVGVDLKYTEAVEDGKLQDNIVNAPVATSESTSSSKSTSSSTSTAIIKDSGNSSVHIEEGKDKEKDKKKKKKDDDHGKKDKPSPRDDRPKPRLLKAGRGANDYN